MKERIVARLRSISPGAVDAALGVRRRLPARHGEVNELRAELAQLREEVDELRIEIDESRRDARRIAELTDIVEYRLTTPRES